MSSEYLVSFGVSAFLGRFRAEPAVALARGDRAVVRTSRGIELGEVLGPSCERMARLLPGAEVGELLRPAASDDLRVAEELVACGDALMAEGERRAALFGLTIKLLDVELMLDGTAGVLHLIRWADADPGEWAGELERQFGLRLRVLDLTAAHDHAPGGCGTCGSGGCGTCGSGGGCDSGGACSKGAVKSAAELSAYFQELRRHMEQRHRVPLN